MQRSSLVTAIAVLQLAVASVAPAAQRLVDVREVPTDTLRDLAIATYENGRGVIYYNPILMQRVGPRLAAFFMAHEYGHIAHGHAGAALTLGGTAVSTRRVQQELEADCYATISLAKQNREAVDAALRFVTRMGPFRFDNFHPTGAQRAAKILSCLPDGIDAPRAEGARADAPATVDAALPM